MPNVSVSITPRPSGVSIGRAGEGSAYFAAPKNHVVLCLNANPARHRIRIRIGDVFMIITDLSILILVVGLHAPKNADVKARHVRLSGPATHDYRRAGTRHSGIARPDVYTAVSGAEIGSVEKRGIHVHGRSGIVGARGA